MRMILGLDAERGHAVTQGVTLAAAEPATVVEAALLGGDVAAIVLVVLGASFVGAEYATGLAQPTFVLTPRRERVLVAKAVVAAGSLLAWTAALLGAAVLRLRTRDV